MIKDKLAEAIETSLENIKSGNDNIPLKMRGELEVIVKDRDGNVLSYERGHNQVTNLAKMAIIHLLAGEIGSVDGNIYSVTAPNSNIQRAYSLTDTEATNFAKIYPSFTPDNHTASVNVDGQLVSGEQFFYEGSYYVGSTTKLSQVNSQDTNGNAFQFNFPTKMLFGTGIESYQAGDMESLYKNEISGMEVSTMCALNGYSNVATVPSGFFSFCSTESSTTVDVNTRLTNWYSNSVYRCKTLQPATVSPLQTTPAADTVSIKGAIKNCFITSTADEAKYNGTTKMAKPLYRGYGYPCFIYAKRSTSNFYNNNSGNQEVYYGRNEALGTSEYESELTYTVNMPAQPVSSTSVSAFYPYNGWILKQAGLFSDSRFKLKSESTGTYSEDTYIQNIASDNEKSEAAKTYRDSVGGQLLFTRNLSSPILKTPDNEVVFVWHIFIAI